MRSSSLLSQQDTARRKSKSKPHFVPCPAGCGKHIAEANIHWHLDQCIPLQSQLQEEPEISSQEDVSIHPQSQLQEENDKQSSTVEAKEQTGESERFETKNEPPSSNLKRDGFALDEKSDQNMPPDGLSVSSDRSHAKRKITPEAVSKSRKSKISAQDKPSTDDPDLSKSTPNAFSLMMDQSRKIFSQPTSSRSDPCAFFCLTNVDGQVSLSTKRPPQHLAWQTTVRVTERIHGNLQSHYIALCSTIPIVGANTGDKDFDRMYAGQIIKDTTISNRRRWVKNHSKLSVSVLKSMLQKSIRRRKPLPAVRLAMELADKSLGELLRRMPIIVLEDSTLCDRYPFLIWMMMTHAALQTGGDDSGANSSSPTFPVELVERVLETIFQVASCRLQDKLSSEDQMHNEDTVSISSLLRQLEEEEMNIPSGIVLDHENKNDDTDAGCHPKPDERTILPFSILLRACYGGMKGDIAMLHQFSNLWHCRINPNAPAVSLNEGVGDDSSPRIKKRVCNLPASLGQLLDSNGLSTTSLISPSPWLQVPCLLHDKASDMMNLLVRPLLKSGLHRLSLDDACLEGVDFHCSDILESLIQNPDIGGVALDLLSMSLPEKRREVLQAILNESWKTFMWDELSGVNHRRSLDDENKAVPTENNDGPDSTRALLSGIWNELVKPSVRSYQVDFVRKCISFDQN